MKKVNLEEKFKKINTYWDPKILGELNNQEVKIAKFKGEFVRHQHDNEDELFLVIKGNLQIDFDDETISLSQGEFIIVPKGVYHKPHSDDECEVLLFEPKTTLNTGDVENHLTKHSIDKI